MSHTIIVVEDDAALRDGLRDLLEANGYDVLTAADGVEGLAVMATAMPDLILTDIRMPNMDGYEFVAQVRSRPEWITVPVIFLTAKGDRRDVRRGKELGAEDYLTKPFDHEDLLVTVAAKLRRRTELEEAHAREVADIKQAILAALNHEFRSPLASIVAYSELLSSRDREMDTATFDEFMGGLRQGVDRLTRVVEDCLLLVSLETGQARADYQYRLTRLDWWPGFLDSVVQPFRKLAAERGVTVSIDCPTDLPAAEVDPVLLADALSRLVDNAIKFSKPEGGQVCLSVAANGEWLRISVADTGIGIRPSDLPRVFEPFEQVNRPQREQQGTGIGLAICRAIVELHAGEVTVSSTPGEGSTFEIRLPQAH